MKNKKLILFNLSGTLLLPTEQVLLAWCNAIRQTGLKPNDGIVYSHFSEDFKETVIPLLAEKEGWTDLQTETVIQNAKRILNDNNLNCSVGLAEKLEKLKAAGYEMGIITSHTSTYLDKRLFKLGISRNLFKVIKTSDDEIKKPDIRVFDQALELFPAKDIVFVGHNYHKDFVAAKNCGLDFVAITSANPRGLFEVAGVPSERIFGKITDFIDLMLK